MFRTERDLKMHVQDLGVSPHLKNWGPKHNFLRRLRNLMGSLTAYVFGMKHDMDNRISALETTMGLLRCLKMS